MNDSKISQDFLQNIWSGILRISVATPNHIFAFFMVYSSMVLPMKKYWVLSHLITMCNESTVSQKVAVSESLAKYES